MRRKFSKIDINAKMNQHTCSQSKREFHKAANLVPLKYLIFAAHLTAISRSELRVIVHHFPNQKLPNTFNVLAHGKKLKTFHLKLTTGLQINKTYFDIRNSILGNCV